jgi:hypothetical protein
MAWTWTADGADSLVGAVNPRDTIRSTKGYSARRCEDTSYETVALAIRCAILPQARREWRGTKDGTIAEARCVAFVPQASLAGAQGGPRLACGEISISR